MNNEMLDKLNSEQKEAVVHGTGPLLIVAGAGTGKTMVVTQRIGYLIAEHGLKPDQILALTFTDKAAQEMEERVDKLLPLGYVDLWIHTFHKFCEQILRAHALDIGLAPDFKLLDQTQQWLLFRQNLDRFDLDYYRPLGNQAKFIYPFIQHFSRCKDEEVYPEEYLAYAEKLLLQHDTPQQAFKAGVEAAAENEELQEALRIKEVAQTYHTYQQILLENNALDFGDLIGYTLKLFRQRPRILRKYQQQFKYVLVDEFQDTDWAQYELVKLLAGETKNLTVVADDDQSIYRFRGASMSNILRFQEDFPDCKQVFLINNYRSKQKILDLAYEFIQQNNPNRLEYQLQQKGDSSLSKQLKANIGDDGQVDYIYCTSLEDEINNVVRKIISVYETEPETDWSDFAILIRANNQADAFMNELENYGVPYTFVASRGLYTKPVILDLLAYLRFIVNVNDSIAAFRVLTMPFIGLDHVAMMSVMHYARKKGMTVFKVLANHQDVPLSDEARSKIETLLGLVNNHSKLAQGKSVAMVVRQIIEEIGLLNWITQQSEGEQLELFAYLNQFFKRLQQFEQASTEVGAVTSKTVRDWLRFFDLSVESGDEGNLPTDYEIGPETVKIMTVHASKGLEFKYVFIVNMVDKRFPSISRKDPIQIPPALLKENLEDQDVHLEEERRLFYVALTRAKEGVWLTAAADYGGARAKKVSRFLTELGFEAPDEIKTEIIGISDQHQPKPALETQEIKDLPLPAKFSFTQLKVFATCPYQYKLAHIYKVQGFGKKVFSYGTSMHSALQTFYQRMIDSSKNNQAQLFSDNDEKGLRVPSMDDLMDIFDNVWVDEWYESEADQAEAKAKGRSCLKEYYKKHDGHWRIPLVLEKGINLRVGPYTLIGRVDRIDELDDKTLEIIDYKTGNKPDSVSKMNSWNKNQLLIYQMAFKEIYQKPVGKVTFYYLDKNEELSFVGTDEDLAKLELLIVETIDKIKQSDFVATPGKHTCKFCDFKSICEFRDL